MQPQGAEAEEAAARELERSFDKADFHALRVIGQFNLGFILARCAGFMSPGVRLQQGAMLLGRQGAWLLGRLHQGEMLLSRQGAIHDPAFMQLTYVRSFACALKDVVCASWSGYSRHRKQLFVIRRPGGA